MDANFNLLLLILKTDRRDSLDGRSLTFGPEIDIIFLSGQDAMAGNGRLDLGRDRLGQDRASGMPEDFKIEAIVEAGLPGRFNDRRLNRDDPVARRRRGENERVGRPVDPPQSPAKDRTEGRTDRDDAGSPGFRFRKRNRPGRHIHAAPGEAE